MVILPYMMAFMAVCFYSSLSPISKVFLTNGVPPFALMTIANLFLVVFSFAASLVVDKHFSYQALPRGDWAGIALFAFINFIGYFLFLYALKKIPVTEYQMMYLLSPIIGGFIAFLLLSEPFHWRYLVGLAFVAAGLYIALMWK